MGALTVTILICAAGMPRQACNADVAIAVMHPARALYAEYGGLNGCASFGQKFAASSPYFEPDENGVQRAWPKLLCTIGAAAGSVG